MKKTSTLMFGDLPKEVAVPPIPLSRWKLLRLLLPAARRFASTVKTYQRHLDTHITAFPARCTAARRHRTSAAPDGPGRDLGRTLRTPDPRRPRMLAAGGRVNGMAMAKLRPWLRRHVDAPNIDELLQRRAARSHDARQRFVDRYPSKAKTLNRRMTAAAEAVGAREATRSEAVRSGWVVRDFVRRAGVLTGHGEDVFFLDIGELLAPLTGDDTGLSRVAARRAAYDHYRRLPVYPTWIRGAFDPEAFAADTHRRLDLFDANAVTAPTAAEAITGTAGSAGTAEGTARVIADADQAHRLGLGDILVTKITNIGWTPVFPRLGGVVTDIGATLSHASIVARELGIPAVVGCGDATARIRDGDRIRIDGGNGTVDIIERADMAGPT